LADPSNRLTTPLRRQFERIDNDWAPLLAGFAGRAAGKALCEAVDARTQAGAIVYPGEVFQALALTPLRAVRAVILGQDPYHGPGQAEGLAFSVAPGLRWPPSLRNILQEWHRDLGLPLPQSGSLRPWAEQGVLLLNTCLTVEDAQPAAHAKLGWQALTELIVEAIVAQASPTVFLLWGSHAQGIGGRAAAAEHHRVLACNHPSPLSARRGPVPFVGCGHFGEAARFLEATGRGPLHWALA
jgi:uracil-DNA glycosylase